MVTQCRCAVLSTGLPQSEMRVCWHCCTGSRSFTQLRLMATTPVYKPSHLSQLYRNTAKYGGRDALMGTSILMVTLSGTALPDQFLPPAHILTADSFSSFRSSLQCHLLRQAHPDCSSAPYSYLYSLFASWSTLNPNYNFTHSCGLMRVLAEYSRF